MYQLFQDLNLEVGVKLIPHAGAVLSLSHSNNLIYIKCVVRYVLETIMRWKSHLRDHLFLHRSCQDRVYLPCGLKYSADKLELALNVPAWIPQTVCVRRVQHGLIYTGNIEYENKIEVRQKKHKRFLIGTPVSYINMQYTKESILIFTLVIFYHPTEIMFLL